MKAISVEFSGFRNLETSLSFGDGVNLLVGKNGEGKTNIAEGLWLNSAGKSFRNASDREMLRFGANCATVRLVYETRDGVNELKTVLHADTPREIYHNGVRLRRIADSVGLFSAVVFTPETLGLVGDGPSERRRFVDIAISQLKPAYLRSLMTYNAALSERNACLKLLRGSGANDYQLLAWECMMAPDGARVMGERMMYIRRLSVIAAEEYAKITSGGESLAVKYIPGGQMENELAVTAEKLKPWNRREPYGSVERMELFETENGLLQRLFDSRRRDIKDGSTGTGPHRDDIEILINGKSARDYASQGQKRSAVLAVKAAECRIIAEETGEEPVVILDDVLSELDALRRRYVLGSLSQGQTVITSCDTARLGRAAKGKIFEISAGTAKERLQ